MVAAVRAMASRQPAKLAIKENERPVQQPSLVEIRQQRRSRLIGVATIPDQTLAVSR